MKVIEFPKSKTAEETADSTSALREKKIFNIADWAPRVHFDTSNIDNWPFCAA
jgi:hypothetical protein